jgi:hypothetical protein
MTESLPNAETFFCGLLGFLAVVFFLFFFGAINPFNMVNPDKQLFAASIIIYRFCNNFVAWFLPSPYFTIITYGYKLSRINLRRKNKLKLFQ